MPQMSLYIDESLASKIAKEAKRNRVSVSRYVSDILRDGMNEDWTDDFLATLGSVKDDSFIRPKQPNFSADSKKGSL